MLTHANHRAEDSPASPLRRVSTLWLCSSLGRPAPLTFNEAGADPPTQRGGNSSGPCGRGLMKRNLAFSLGFPSTS
jgi:hypothetical protein